jgi:hypothetical protein
VEPVSTTTISSNRPATDDKQLEMFFSSSRTIIVSESVALALETETDEPQMNSDEHRSDRGIEPAAPISAGISLARFLKSHPCASVIIRG